MIIVIKKKLDSEKIFICVGNSLIKKIVTCAGIIRVKEKEVI